MRSASRTVNAWMRSGTARYLTRTIIPLTLAISAMIAASERADAVQAEAKHQAARPVDATTARGWADGNGRAGDRENVVGRFLDGKQPGDRGHLCSPPRTDRDGETGVGPQSGLARVRPLSRELIGVPNGTDGASQKRFEPDGFIQRELGNRMARTRMAVRRNIRRLDVDDDTAARTDDLNLGRLRDHRKQYRVCGNRPF